MCFSATGSFAIAGALTLIGVASVAGNASRSSRMFAVTPLLFAAQQATEGVVWLTMYSPTQTALHRIAVTLFLALAFVAWPIWVPWSLRQAEQSESRRRVLTLIFRFGCAIAAGAAFMLWRWPPVAVIAGHSIQYNFAGSSEGLLQAALIVAYIIPIVAPFFVSTNRLARTIGIMVVLSLAATSLIEQGTLTSVWCFFAAILSGLIMIAVRREQTLVVPRPA